MIKFFLDIVICCSFFDKRLSILCTAEFCVLITTLIFNGFLCTFNNDLAEGIFEVWGFKSLYNFSLINPLYLSSFNFLLTLDLTLSLLSFFKLWHLFWLFNSISMILPTFSSSIVHVALSLSASTNINLISRCGFFYIYFSLQFNWWLFLSRFKIFKYSSLKLFFMYIAGMFFVASSTPDIMSSNGKRFFVTL